MHRTDNLMYDCVLFDIDGVLVDIRKSYNAAIKETVDYVLKFITGNSFRTLVTDQIISCNPCQPAKEHLAGKEFSYPGSREF
jgi:hypothetical protein